MFIFIKSLQMFLQTNRQTTIDVPLWTEASKSRQDSDFVSVMQVQVDTISMAVFLVQGARWAVSERCSTLCLSIYTYILLYIYTVLTSIVS